MKLSTDVERIASFINFDKVNLQNKPIYLILVTDSFEIQDMVRSMIPYSYYQVLSNLLLYSMNSEAINTFVNMFNYDRDYIELFINDYVEGQLIQGLGRAYGTEVYIKKSKGKLGGWVSYTLSKTERLVRGISNDDWFRSRYDRTHCLNTNFIFCVL